MTGQARNPTATSLPRQVVRQNLLGSAAGQLVRLAGVDRPCPVAGGIDHLNHATSRSAAGQQSRRQAGG